MRHVLTILLLCLAFAGCRQGDDDPVAAAPPVPESWDGMEPLVREHIEIRLAQAQAAPDDVAAWSALAVAYHANDLVDLAAPCYERTMEMEGDDARTWFLLARARAELGDVDGAIAAVDEAILLAPKEPFPYWRRGFWLLEAGRLDDAEASFSRALEISELESVAMVGLARVAAARGDDEAASIALKRVVGSFTGSNGLYVRHLLGEAYMRMGREDEAEQLMSQDPITHAWSDPWSDELYHDRRLSEWIIVRAHNMVQSGRPQEAMELLRPLIETHGDDPVVLKMIGQVAFAIGDVELATTAMQRVVEELPFDLSANMNLAYVYEQREMFAEALPYAEKAADLGHGQPAAQIQLARILSKAGQHDRAMEVFEAYAATAPDDPKLGPIREDLERRAGRR